MKLYLSVKNQSQDLNEVVDELGNPWLQVELDSGAIAYKLAGTSVTSFYDSKASGRLILVGRPAIVEFFLHETKRSLFRKHR